MKVKLIIISIVLLLVIVFACGCIPFMEKLGLVNPTKEEQLSPEKASPDGLVKVLIGFKEKPGPPEQALVKGFGGKIKYTYHLVPAIAASVPEAAIEALKKNPNITHVELDGEIFAIGQILPWGVDRIDAEVVHAFVNKGAEVKVAIIDSGIDRNHEDLSVAGGKSFVRYTKNFDDDNGHGTHVAGIVAALDNEIGVVGVAPEASLYALKVLDFKGSGRYSDVIAALEWCVDYGIQVTNNSYGSSGDPGKTVKDAFDIAYSNGILNIAAAGNGGAVIYPAAYENVIAVSATDSSDNLASFSSVGPEVELAAPGAAIYSTYKDGGYTTMSGTSMASPHVAGTAALVIAARITNVRDQLQTYAEDLGSAGVDSEYGYGLVDAENAVLGTTSGNNLPPPATGTIAGKVTAADTGLAIEGAKVVVEGTNLSADTDTNGDYTITDIAEGTYTVTASATGYIKDSQSADVSEGGTTVVDFTLTPETTPSNTMHVFSIDMSFKTVGINVNAIATVTIFDTSGNPVGGATVSGTWSDATSDMDSGVTDTYGKVSLQSNKLKKPESGTTFTFTVDGVAKDEWTYDPTKNVVISDSITVP